MTPRIATVFALCWLAACGGRTSPGNGGVPDGKGGAGGNGATSRPPDAAVSDAAVGGDSADGAAGGGAPGGIDASGGAIGGKEGGVGGNGAASGGLAGNGAGSGSFAGNGPSGGGLAGSGAGAGGGSGPSDPGTSLLLPANCEARGRMETGDECMLSAYCDSIAHVTTCQRLASGRWRCTSEPHHVDRIYEIEGAAGLQACAVTTGINAKEMLALGKDTCEPVAEASAEGYCSTDMVCGPFIEVDFAPGVRARLARYGSAECVQRLSPSVIDCGFRFHDTTKGYDLSVYSSSFACRPFLEFCMSTSAADFTGPRSCIATEATSTVDGCERSELCSDPMPSTDEAGMTKVKGQYARCEPGRGGGADCYCSERDSTFQFHVASAPDDPTCAAVMASCAPTADIKVTGNAICQQQSQTTNPDSCEADLSCTQAATVDGREIVADGRLLVRCARQDARRPWSCTCASDQLTAAFPLGTAVSTSGQACRQAPEECVKHIPVHVGPYGSVVSPPDPTF